MNYRIGIAAENPIAAKVSFYAKRCLCCLFLLHPAFEKAEIAHRAERLEASDVFWPYEYS